MKKQGEVQVIILYSSHLFVIVIIKKASKILFRMLFLLLFDMFDVTAMDSRFTYLEA